MCSLRAMRRAIGRRNTGSFSNSTSAGMSPLIKLVEILLAVSLDRLDQRGICPLIELVEILRGWVSIRATRWRSSGYSTSGVLSPLIEPVEILLAVGFDTRDSLALSCCSTSVGICPLIELVEILWAAGFDTRDSLALVVLLNQRGYESAD